VDRDACLVLRSWSSTQGLDHGEGISEAIIKKAYTF
jgi:hypothetical protein